MNEIMLIILANGLVNNVVLARRPVLLHGRTNKIGSAIGMSLATTFVITVSCFHRLDHRSLDSGTAGSGIFVLC